MWGLWPVAILPRARSAGACSCWPTDSWSLGSWRRSPRRPSGGRSKGGHQAVGEETVVHPRGGIGVCVAHGGCARSLRGALRSEEAGGVLRRVALADGGREKRTPLPQKPGRPQRYDYDYERKGMLNIFAFFEPKGGWRHLGMSPIDARRWISPWLCGGWWTSTLPRNREGAGGA